MKPTTLFNLGLTVLAASSTATAAPAMKGPVADSIVRRDNCHSGELKVYRTGDSFLCVGTTVFWTGVTIGSVTVAVAGNAAQQFATWVINKFQGTSTATESKRSYEDAYVYHEDDEKITYAWTPPTVSSRDSSPLYVHNMTKQYNKTDGSLIQANMAFQGQFDTTPINGTSSEVQKRSSPTIYITYWAESGHQTTSLDYDQIESLYREIFYNAQPSAGSECGYAANSGTWHGAWKVTVQGCRDAGVCSVERSY